MTGEDWPTRKTTRSSPTISRFSSKNFQAGGLTRLRTIVPFRLRSVGVGVPLNSSIATFLPLSAFGLPQIDGYKPRFNFQASLEEAVARWLARHPDWFIEARNPSYSMQETPALSFSVAPTLQNSEPPEETAQMQRVAVKFDVAGRDARNRALGKAGEARVFHHERSDLMVRGLEHLARRVRWVAEEDGDGLGYDILSFSPEGKERLIEVKTTTGWERTPFHMTINEVEVSRERQDVWRLYRLYDFARAPKAFELRPPLEAHVALMATTFQASFPRKSR